MKGKNRSVEDKEEDISSYWMTLKEKTEYWN